MDSFLNNLIPSASQHSVGWEDAPFLARLTGVYTPTTGTQTGINLYSFIEQSFDPTTGIPFDLPAGRQTYPPPPYNPALDYVPTSAYAIEDNNALLTVPGEIPPGFPDTGPYVEMRLKGVVGGVPVYEFNQEISKGALLLQVTSTTTYTVLGENKSGYTCYKATDYLYGGLYWLIQSNGNEWLPLLGNVNGRPTVKLCLQVDTDADGVPICICDWLEYTYGYRTPAFSPTIASTFSVSYGEEPCAVLGIAPSVSTSAPIGTVPVISSPDFICLGSVQDPLQGTRGGDLLVYAGPSAYTNQFTFAVGPYLGMTGTDGVGNFFVNGICVGIGEGPVCGDSGGGTSSTGTSSGGGSALGLVIDCGRWG